MTNTESFAGIGMLSTAKDAALVNDVVLRMGLRSPKTYRVQLIPTAGDNKARENNQFLPITIDALRTIGFGNIEEVDVANLSKSDFLEKLNSETVSDEQQRLLVISGGNSYYLRHHLEQSGADGIIKNEVQSGKLKLLTVSAGSTNMGSTLSLAGSGNEIGLAHTKGVGLVDFGVLCHYEAQKESDIKERLRDVSETATIVAISNQQALVGNGNNFSVIGGEATMFEKTLDGYSVRLITGIPVSI